MLGMDSPRPLHCFKFCFLVRYPRVPVSPCLAIPTARKHWKASDWLALDPKSPEMVTGGLEMNLIT